MNLRKNAQAKIGVVLASAVALIVGWGLVHQNPPPPATAADAPIAAPTTAAPQGRSRASAPAAPTTTKRTTRTHAS